MTESVLCHGPNRDHSPSLPDIPAIARINDGANNHYPAFSVRPVAGCNETPGTARISRGSPESIITSERPALHLSLADEGRQALILATFRLGASLFHCAEPADTCPDHGVIH